MKKAILLFTIVLILSPMLLADIPKLISYQGVLKDSTGELVEDNVYAIKFMIYYDSLSGSVIWESEGFVPIETNDGLFQHILGSTNPLPDSISLYDNLWLSITIGLDEEITPRTQLISVPFSLTSQYADTANYAFYSVYTANADSALYSDHADSSKHAIFADTSEYSRRVFPFYHRIASELEIDSTNSDNYVQVGNTLFIPAGEVRSYVIVVLLAGAFIGFNHSCYLDIRIGEEGLETSKDENLITQPLGSHDIRALNTIQFYYEPTESEKSNGFNVKIYMKVSHTNYQAILHRCEVFGL